MQTDAGGFWSQNGFQPGTTYRVTPSLPTYTFNPPSRDFTTPAELDFAATFIECSGLSPFPISPGQTVAGSLATGGCTSPVFGSNRFADRYSFSGTGGEQVTMLVTSRKFTPAVALICNDQVLSQPFGSGTSVRLPSSGFFTLPNTGPCLVEVSSNGTFDTGDYDVSFADASLPYPVAGILTATGAPLPGVTVTFSRVLGTGALPAPVQTDAMGFWSQTGFVPGTTYRVTPSLGTYTFTPPSRDFTTIGELDFTATFVECNVLAPVPIAPGQTVGGALTTDDCTSPVFGSNRFADRYSFDGTQGQQVAILVNSTEVTPAVALVCNNQVLSQPFGSGTSVRLPAVGFLTLPATGPCLIEVSSSATFDTGAYHLSLAYASLPYPVAGIVTGLGMGLPGVTMTFDCVGGSGVVPLPVQTDGGGFWAQTGFEVGPTCTVTPSLAGFTFTPVSRTFTTLTALNFSGLFSGVTMTTTTTTTTTTTGPCTVNLGIGDGVSPPSTEFCVDLNLTNGRAIRAVQTAVIDVPDEFQLSRCQCASRTAAFSCQCNEIPATNRINVVILDAGGGCIASGSGPIARICLTDRAPLCPLSNSVQLNIDPSPVVADCSNNQPCDVSRSSGAVRCCGSGLLGDCNGDGHLDLLDILTKIDIVLGRVTPTPAQVCICDDTCDSRIDVFDVLREIDALLGRIPTPLACPTPTPSVTAQVLPAGAHGAGTSEPTSHAASAKRRGSAILLQNRDEAVRGLELTLSPVHGPVDILGVRSTRRTRRFMTAFHQASATAPAKILVLSLRGEAIQPGHGPVVRVQTRHDAGHGHWKVTDARIVK